MSRQCVLCGGQQPKLDFNLKSTLSSYSKKPLLELLKDVSSKEFTLSAYDICNLCYILLNELDGFKVKMAIITKKLNNYVTKYWVHKPITQEFKQEPPADDTKREEISPPIKPQVKKKFSIAIPKDEHVEIGSEPFVKSCKEFRCTTCGKIWKSMSQLKNHELSHEEKKSFICDICGHAYKRKNNLVTHIAMHNGVVPFKCPHCNKVFTQKVSLKRHLLMHTGEQPFQCDLCGKRFLHHSSFTVHKLSHSGEKNFTCKTCGIKFALKSHLTRHQRVHSGEKNHVCHVCARTFAERYNLMSHLKVHRLVHSEETSETTNVMVS